MPNTTLNEDVQPAPSGNLADRSTVHREINRMSRDTGRMDIPLSNGWTLAAGGFLYARRVDDTVTIYARGLDGSAATSNVIATVGTSGIYSGMLPESTNLPAQSPQFTNDLNRTDPWYLQLATTSIQARVASDGAAAGVVRAMPPMVQWSYKTARNWAGLPTPS